MSSKGGNGGNFGVSLSINGPPDGRVAEIANGSNSSHTFTLLSIEAPGSTGFSMDVPAGEVAYVDALFATITIDSLDVNVLWRYTILPAMLTGATLRFVKFKTPQPVQPQPYLTLVDDQVLIPTSLAALGGESTLVAGANPIGQGVRVTYRLSMGGPIATPADPLCYIALKGHTSGDYLAVCYAGMAISGQWDFADAVNENLDIVARNADTVVHGVAAAWEGMSP